VVVAQEWMATVETETPLLLVTVVLVMVFGLTLAVAVVHPRPINEAHKEHQEKDTVLVVTVAMLQLVKKQETLG
jgi:hypothetical protein